MRVARPRAATPRCPSAAAPAARRTWLKLFMLLGAVAYHRKLQQGGRVAGKADGRRAAAASGVAAQASRGLCLPRDGAIASRQRPQALNGRSHLRSARLGTRSRRCGAGRASAVAAIACSCFRRLGGSSKGLATSRARLSTAGNKCTAERVHPANPSYSTAPSMLALLHRAGCEAWVASPALRACGAAAGGACRRASTAHDVKADAGDCDLYSILGVKPSATRRAAAAATAAGLPRPPLHVHTLGCCWPSITSRPCNALLPPTSCGQQGRAETRVPRQGAPAAPRRLRGLRRPLPVCAAAARVPGKPSPGCAARLLGSRLWIVRLPPPARCQPGTVLPSNIRCWPTLARASCMT